VNCKALDIVRVTEIMALGLFIDVVEDDCCGYKINNFASWELIKVTATIFAPITIDLKIK
jgi:hypothetical protein